MKQWLGVNLYTYTYIYTWAYMKRIKGLLETAL